jgi:methyl-accepting chemotaxis protein
LEQQLNSQRDDELGRLYDAIDEMCRSLSAKITEAEQARQEAKEAQKAAESAEQEATQMAEAYQVIVEEYAATMQQAAEGNLTKRIDVSTEYKAMETIGTEFNKTMDNLTATLTTVDTFANDIQQNVDMIISDGEAIASNATSHQ